MNSLLHDLQNNEAILLMYLANELPAQDRAEVEHMLDRDDALRLELAKIRQGYNAYHATMQRMDAAMPPVSAFAAARAVGDTLRSRLIEPESVDDHDEPHRRIHWIFYPLGAVAALLIGMFLWWQFPQEDNLSKPIVMVTEQRRFDPSFDRGPGGFGGWGGEMGELSDDQIQRIFETPIVSDRGFESQRQLSVINYLNEALQ